MKLAMRKNRRSIAEIIEAAGGAEKVALALGGAVSVGAVCKWFQNGIPDWHWPMIIPLAGTNADEMMAANMEARFSKKSNGLQQVS
jgi:hypothetical protein